MQLSIVERIAALGGEINGSQYKIVRLAAEYDTAMEWFHQGFSNPAAAIARTLDIHTSTAREWIRVGHALEVLPCIDDAFRSNCLSYAKARILTRWASPGNEQELLDLARSRNANRLTTAVANFLARNETDAERDRRHHDNRGVTVRTDAEGMVIIRAALPPEIGKHVAEALNTIVQKVATTPLAFDNEEDVGASEDACSPPPVVDSVTIGGRDASADASDIATMTEQLRQLKRRWQPAGADDFCIPSLQLDQSFIRMMIHDADKRPVNASIRRRHPTTRQKRIVLEAHNRRDGMPTIPTAA